MSNVLWQILVIILTVAVVVQAVVIVGILRQLGSVLLRLSPARPGEVEGGPAVGATATIPEVQNDIPTIVVFVSQKCILCEALLPGLATLKRSYPEVQVLTVPWGDDDEELAFYSQTLGPGARPDLSYLAQEWNVQGTPFAVGLDKTSTVRSTGVVNTLEHLEALAEITLLPSEEKATDHPELEIISSPTSTDLARAGTEETTV